MACLSSWHKKDSPLGKGKCSLPMWDGYGCPAGFCDKRAYGLQTKNDRLRHPHRYLSALACSAHGGPTLEQAIVDRTIIRFDGPPGPKAGRFVEVERNGASISFGDWIQDGDDWLLVLPTFGNNQETA